MIDNNRVLEALRLVKDPVSGVSIIDVDRLQDYRVKDAQVSFSLVASGLDDQVRLALHEACLKAVHAIYPDAEVHIHMITDRLSAVKVRVLPQVKHIIAIGSGKGGVGKSTVTANIGRALRAQGHQVGIIDADVYGPSMPTIFGMEGERPGVQNLAGKTKMTPLETDEGIQLMSVGFVVNRTQAVILRGPRLSGVIKQFISETLWPDLEYLLIDLPPGTGDVQLTLVQTLPLTGAVIVTTPQRLAVADAIKASNMFRLENVNVPILGVVENMAYFVPPDMPDKRYEIFGSGGGRQLADEIEAKVLGQLPITIAIRASSDAAIRPEDDWYVPEGIFGTLAEAFVDAVNYRVAHLPPTEIVGVS